MLLVRAGLFAVLLGLGAGLALRAWLRPEGRRRRLPLVAALSLLPFALHLLNTLAFIARHELPVMALAVVGATGALLGLGALLTSLQLARSGPAALPLVPLALALAYQLPLVWLGAPLAAAEVTYPVLITWSYWLATLFAAALLLAFAPEGPRLGLPRLPFSRR